MGKSDSLSKAASLVPTFEDVDSRAGRLKGSSEIAKRISREKEIDAVSTVTQLWRKRR